MFCSTDLCLTVNKEEKRAQCLCTDVSSYEVYILSTVDAEDTHTPARMGALLSNSQSSVPPVTCSPSLGATAFVVHPKTS